MAKRISDWDMTVVLVMGPLLAIICLYLCVHGFWVELDLAASNRLASQCHDELKQCRQELGAATTELEQHAIEDQRLTFRYRSIVDDIVSTQPRAPPGIIIECGMAMVRGVIRAAFRVVSLPYSIMTDIAYEFRLIQYTV